MDNFNKGPFDTEIDRVTGQEEKYFKEKLKNITDVTEENADYVGVYIVADLDNKNFPISFDNSYFSRESTTGNIRNSNNITIKNSLFYFNNIDKGNKLTIENSYLDGYAITNFKEIKVTNSYLPRVSGVGNINLTNSAINSLGDITGTITINNGGSIGSISLSNIELNAIGKKAWLGAMNGVSGKINNSDIKFINGSNDLTISNSTILTDDFNTSIASYNKLTLIDSIVTSEVYGSSIVSEGSTFNDKIKSAVLVNSKGSTFNKNITADELILSADKVKAIETIKAGKYDINKLDTGDKYYLNGNIIGEGTIKNSTINMQLSGSKYYKKSDLINQGNFYDNFNDGKVENTSRISLDNVIATNSVRASTLDIKNSKIAKRVLANNLTSDNSTYYLGANKESYTGAIISRENTSGKDNTLALLNVIKDGKLDTSKLDENLVLAILKKGTGNAELATFFKTYKVSDGASDYEINDDYIAKADMKGYLAYAITKDKKANISTTGLNESNIESIANGDKTSELGKRVNESAGDYDGSEGLKLALNNLANKTPKTPNNSNTDSGSNTGSNTGNTNTGNTGSSTGSNSGSSTGSSTGSNTGSNSSSSTGNTGNTGNTNTGNTDTGSNTGSNSGSSTGSSTGNTNTGNTNNNENTNSNNNSVKPILADDFIKSIKLNDKVKSQANVLAKGVNFIHNLEWNNVNKRLGEIRNLDADTGVWARLYHTNASVLDEVNLNSLELQFGADKQSEVSNAKIYSGVVGSVSKAKADDNILKSTGFGVGLYVSAVADNGYYADLVAKVNRYKMTFNAATLDEIKENKTGFLASLELGKRFDVNNFYLEPSVEAIVDYTPSLKLENDKILIKTKSSTNLHLKPALAAGLNLNDNANLRLGAGYIIDVNKPKNATITAKNSKVKEVIKGERDNKFYINLGGSYKINDNLRLNLGYERTFSADYNIDHQINAVVRYTF